MVVLFSAAVYFRVHNDAALRALGTETDSIKFLPLNSGYNTLGIQFENASNESILEYCYFESALYGAVELSNCSMTIRNCRFEDNHGYTSGGVIIATEGSNALVEYCDFIDNEAGQHGGAIYCNSSSPIINGCLFEGNSTGSIGGAISCENYSNPVIKNSTFLNNEADPITFPPFPGRGGAIYVDDNSSPTITGNLFKNNRVDSGAQISYAGGGAIFVFSENPVITHNVFDGNRADGDDGGAIYLFNSRARIINNVFINNYAGDYGGAIRINLSPTPDVINSILFNNFADQGPAIYVTDADVNVSYSNIQGGWEGEGNIDTDPLLRNPSAGDYHLMAIECGDAYDSPCIDVGSPMYIDSLLDCDWGLGTELSDMGVYGGGNMMTSVDNDFVVPSDIAVISNYPNPFNARTTITFNLPAASKVNLIIFDMLGREVKALIQDKTISAGQHRITWDASSFASGMYFYSLKTEKSSFDSKMLLIK